MFALGNKNMPFVSIVIVNYNRKEWLSQCLPQVTNLNYPAGYEVIVVDNNSSDGSADFVRKNFKNVKVVSLDKNYGAAEGKNVGIRNSCGDYVYFLDSDVEVEKDCLIELVKAAELTGAGVCGSRVKEMGSNLLSNCGDFINIFGILKHRGMGEEDVDQFGEITEVFSLPSCSMLVSRELIKKMRFWFDPKFFIYFEDTEFCWQARLLGFKVLYVPKSVIYHRARDKSEVNPNSLYFSYRNRLWAFKRNFRSPLKQFFLFNVFLITCLGIFYWSVKRKWGFGIKIFEEFFSEIEKFDLSKITLKKQLRVLNPRIF